MYEWNKKLQQLLLIDILMRKLNIIINIIFIIVILLIFEFNKK